jgi:hypothetical protein
MSGVAISVLVLAGGMFAQNGADHKKLEKLPEPFVLKMTTREVIIDLLATDRRGHPIRDLRADELKIHEVQGGTRRPIESIPSFRVIDPDRPETGAEGHSGGFRVTIGGGCANRATFHYELAYHPESEGWQSGFHEIEITTSRADVKLAYRNKYYVGQTEAPPSPASRDEAEKDLQEAACHHPAIPPSISLNARPVDTGRSDVYRFFVTVDPDSLAFITMTGAGRRVQLDYGICTFDQGGHPLRYMHAEADRQLSSSEYAQTDIHGFPNLIEFPRLEEPAMARVVVRDRTTANLGSVDIALVPPAPYSLTPDEQIAADMWNKHLMPKEDHRQTTYGDPLAPGYYQQASSMSFPPLGPIGSFGSIVPEPGALCGDVYELPANTLKLPTFWNLSSIGSVYASTLNVPHQQFWNTGGIPGLTRNTEWFGIDYHGSFWVNRAGTYQFQLSVDDGAKLFIDDELVIDLDGTHNWELGSGKIKLDAGPHLIHVPYFQGPPRSVGLELLVKSPTDQSFHPFDMRDFAPPNAKSAAPGSSEGEKKGRGDKPLQTE